MNTFIIKYLDEDYQIIKSYEMDVSSINLNNYSIIIILGGHQHVKNLDCSLQKVIILIKECIDQNKPILGICLGCQAIAYVLGCEIKDSGKLNIGFDTEIFGYKNIFRCHHDYVVPNGKIDILDYFDSMLYAFRYKKCIGIQCHPDIPPNSVLEYQGTFLSKFELNKDFDEIDKNNKAMIDYILKELRKK